MRDEGKQIVGINGFGALIDAYHLINIFGEMLNELLLFFEPVQIYGINIGSECRWQLIEESWVGKIRKLILLR